MTSCDDESQASLTTATSNKSKHHRLQELGERHCRFSLYHGSGFGLGESDLSGGSNFFYFPGCKIN